MKSNFSKIPSVSITRSKFLRKSKHMTSLKIGEITPIYIDEVLPGDTRKIDMGALIQMSNPVAPFFDNVFIDYYAFFVPNRLCDTTWKNIMGENTTSSGIYTGTEYTVPHIPITGNVFKISVGQLGDHFGLPTGLTGTDTGVTVYPVRGYRLIYNRFFRDQNLIAPVTVANGGSYNSTYDKYNVSLFKAAKVSDYFTRSLPYAQKGAAVSIPLGTTAPLKTGGIYAPGNIMLGVSGATALNSPLYSKSQYVHVDPSGTAPSGTTNVDSINLYADLSSATAATINTLRFAFQYQKLLEKDSLYGSRYAELLKAHFGVTAPDASLQDPELLGHFKRYLNVDPVIQTTGIDQSTISNNELGEMAACSRTSMAGNLFTKSFTEHGFIHIYAVARHDQTYGQGIERMWSRSHRTDFYFPVFANLGAQEVLRKEIYATGGSSNDEAVFGYQEAWSEYRYKPSKVTGLLNPSVSNSLGYYTLANNFSSVPTLSSSFIEQTNSNLQRVLRTGSSGPDFICDFAFLDTAVRPLPVYSLPGLIDHH